MRKQMKKSLLIATMFVAFIVVSGNAFDVSAQDSPMVGSYQEVSKTDREAVSAAKFAIRSEKRQQGGRLSLISIERAERQVVAGLNYRLCLKVKMKGKTENATAVVYKNLEQKYALSSWDTGCNLQQ
jgi:hypothetical protein